MSDAPPAAIGAPAILNLWDDAREHDAVGRAVELAAAADPAIDVETAAGLPVGECNARLLRVRAGWTDRPLEVVVECPHCGERLELGIDPVDLLEVTPSDCVPLTVGDRVIRWRPVTSRDLLAAAAEADLRRAERLLIDRCVLEVSMAGATLVEFEPSPAERTALAAALEHADPLSHVLLEVRCAVCGGSVTAEVEPADVVWSELDRLARRLLAEVDALAAAYGWTEAECLALPAGRRATYLDMIAGGPG